MLKNQMNNQDSASSPSSLGGAEKPEGLGVVAASGAPPSGAGAGNSATEGGSCERCGVPNHKTVLRQCGWWTHVTLEATVWATGGSFRFDPGTRVEQNGAVIETIRQRQFIHLPWRCASERGSPIVSEACFPNTGQHRWVYIVLAVFNAQALCQWCRFHLDARFSGRKRAGLAA